MADIFCSTDMDDFIPLQCGIERAGIRAILLIDVDQDPSQANLESSTFINAAIAASPQQYWLIQPTRGEYNGGTPTEEEGFGTNATQVTGADHEAIVETEGIKDNRDTMESINRRKFKVGLFTVGGNLLYIDVSCSIYAKIMNPKSPKSGSFWQLSIKWQSYDNPKVYTSPDVLLD